MGSLAVLAAADHRGSFFFSVSAENGAGSVVAEAGDLILRIGHDAVAFLGAAVRGGGSDVDFGQVAELAQGLSGQDKQGQNR